MLINHKSSGFTLIELLVVLFIISIVSGTVLMTISRSSTKQVQSVTNELAQTITLAQEQAMLQPSVIGLNISSTAYQFYAYEASPNNKKGIWQPLDAAAFKSHTIPSDVQVTLSSSKASKEEDDTDTNDHPIQPEIMISTSGDVTPFTLYIGKRGAAPMYIIQGESNGSITVKASGEQ